MGVKPEAKRVCILGAGAAGLCAARHSVDRGHDVVVFEQLHDLGGTWLYNPEPNTYSSLYEKMFTNIPKEIMSFEHLRLEHGGPESFPPASGHPRVLAAIRGADPTFDQIQHDRDEGPLFDGNENELITSTETFEFDLLFICNGHFSVPDIPAFASELTIPWLHVHNYRRPHAYAGKTVAVVGAGPSGVDVAMQLCKVAKKVYLLHNGKFKFGMPANVVDKRRVVAVADGPAANGRFVSPLYQHCIHVEYPTSLFVIGLNWRLIPFVCFDFQVKYALALADGTSPIPDDLHEFEEQRLRSLKEAGRAAFRFVDGFRSAVYAEESAECRPDSGRSRSSGRAVSAITLRAPPAFARIRTARDPVFSLAGGWSTVDGRIFYEFTSKGINVVDTFFDSVISVPFHRNRLFLSEFMQITPGHIRIDFEQKMMQTVDEREMGAPSARPSGSPATASSSTGGRSRRIGSFLDLYGIENIHTPQQTFEVKSPISPLTAPHGAAYFFGFFHVLTSTACPLLHYQLPENIANEQPLYIQSSYWVDHRLFLRIREMENQIPFFHLIVLDLRTLQWQLVSNTDIEAKPTAVVERTFHRIPLRQPDSLLNLCFLHIKQHHPWILKMSPEKRRSHGLPPYLPHTPFFSQPLETIEDDEEASGGRLNSIGRFVLRPFRFLPSTHPLLKPRLFVEWPSEQ
ncbi:Flavin-containing monooxygenase [Aphelenchoides fujianensis]|nr:Flavin-containing monooxygenase [Aphelenchoides fujianensis]